MNTRKLKFSRSFRSDLFFPLFLTVCILGLIFLSVPSGSMFGSEVDWLCQHVVIADYMRKQFLSSGSLVPDYMHLGGGGSFFNISYYGISPAGCTALLFSASYIHSSHSADLCHSRNPGRHLGFCISGSA